MKTSLHPLEVIFYIGAWAAGIAASLYHLVIGQEELLDNKTIIPRQLPGLQEGWAAVPRLQDRSDAEWATWKHYVRIFWIPLLVHFLVSECLRKTLNKLVPYWYIAFTLIFTTMLYKLTTTLILLSEPMLYILTLYVTKKKIFIWAMSIVLLITMTYLKKDTLFWHLFDHGIDDAYLVLTSLSWIQLRCITFSFDQIDKENECKINRNGHVSEFKSVCVKMISYSLYFPTLFLGPLILYCDFEKAFDRANQESFSIRLKRFAKDISILIIYGLLFDWTLHYIYFTAFKYNVKNVLLLRNSALCGAGLFMGLHFYVKYVIMYGACGALAGLDAVRPPPAPRCIMRIHLYSHMWKYFDVGLYRFLFKYMYKPTLAWMSGSTPATATVRLLAASATFSFIFVWHGTLFSIFVWSFLNFIGITLETLATFVGTTKSYSSFKKHVLRSDQNEERFLAVLSTPSLMISFVANICYFSSVDVGRVFVERFLSERWYNMLLVYFCMHACCHGSKALVDVPSRTDRNVGNEKRRKNM